MQNRLVNAGAPSKGIAIFTTAPVGLALIPLTLVLVDVLEVSLISYCLLFVNGVCWSAALLLRVRSYEELDTSAATILSTFKLLLLATIGVLVFGESISTARIIGLILTVLAIGSCMEFRTIRTSRATHRVFLSCVFAVCAMGLTKHLSESLPVVLILTADFLIPGVCLIAITKSWRADISNIMESSTGAILIPLICLLSYTFRVYAFSLGGELLIISILDQLGIICVLLIEYLLNVSKQSIRRRCISSGLCTCGAILVTAF